MDIQPTVTITSQILTWINSFTLPGVVIVAWRAARWVSKQEESHQQEMLGFKQEFGLLRTNHFAHMQASLEKIEVSQNEITKAVETSQNEVIKAIVSSQNEISRSIMDSQTAIVQAIL